MTAAVYALKGPAPGRNYSRLHGIFPNGNCSTRVWMYAIGLADGRVKLGISGRPKDRIAGHAAKLGALIQWTHLFAGSVNYAIEKRALALAAHRGQREGRTEFFRGLTRAQIIDCGREAIAAERS